MRKHPWLQMRNSIWYLRAVVPKSLVESMGRREIWRSLKTSDRATADILVQAEAAKIAIEFEQHRKQLRAGPQPVDRAQLEFIVREWAAKLETEKNKDLPPLIKADKRLGVAYEVEETSSLLGHYNRALLDNQFESVSSEVDGIISMHNLAIDKGSDHWKLLAHLVLKAIKRDLTKELGELEGVPSNYTDPLFDIALGKARSIGSGITLGKAIEKYIKEHSPNWVGKTELYYSVGFGLMEAHFGTQKIITEINRDEIREYRDLVRQLPPNHTKFKRYGNLNLKQIAALNEQSGGKVIALKTADRYLSIVTSLFSFAEDEGFVSTNPAKRLASGTLAKGRLSTKNTSPRLPFNDSQLETFFSSEAYRTLSPDDPLRWIPLIAVYQGFRMNEICQLDVADIIFVENVLCFNITSENSHDDKVEGDDSKPVVEKRLKTLASRRTMPVHPYLIDVGFPNLLNKSKLGGHTRLFWQIPAAATGYYSDVFGKHFSRLAKKAGIEKGPVFHSFRHNFRDACRDARIPTDIAFQFGGWTDSRVGNRYGSGYRMSDLLQELRKIRYPTINVPSFTKEDFDRSPSKPWGTTKNRGRKT